MTSDHDAPIKVTKDNLSDLLEEYAGQYLPGSKIVKMFDITYSSLYEWKKNDKIVIRRKDVGKRFQHYNVEDVLNAKAHTRKTKPFLFRKINGVTHYRCNGKCGEWKPRDAYYESNTSNPGSTFKPKQTSCKVCFKEAARLRIKERGPEVSARITRRRVMRERARVKAVARYKEVKQVSARILVWYLETYTHGSLEQVEMLTGVPARRLRRIISDADRGGMIRVETLDKFLTGLDRADLMARFNKGLDANRPIWGGGQYYCQTCYRTTVPHFSSGLCATCYKHRNDDNWVPPVDSKWSRHHHCCTSCHKTDRRHMGHGLCVACYDRKRRQDGRKAAR